MMVVKWKRLEKNEPSSTRGEVWLAANGIVTDASGAVLLILRRDTRTWAVPGGGVEKGELAATAVARELREETGLQVAPGPLTALSLWRNDPTPFLSLYFHCRLTGGRLQVDGREAQRATYHDPAELPWNMLDIHRRPLQQWTTFQQTGLQWQVIPLTGVHKLSKFGLNRLVRPLRRGLWRIQNGGRRLDAPPAIRWEHGAFTVIRNEAGAVLWVRRTDRDEWNLPGGGAWPREAPWETAVRETREETGLIVRLQALTGIYTYARQAHLVFTFAAAITGGRLTTGPEAAAFAWFPPGAEPPNALAQHVERVADAAGKTKPPVFRHQPATVAQDRREITSYE